jgi:hypothetical protein
MNVAILDLISSKPEKNLYGRLLNGNFASIMPQVIGVWAEELGHDVTYVAYAGWEDLEQELSGEMDVLFIAGFTEAAYLAYAISNIFRKRGIVTVFGGPHARSYAEDASRYFDYVVQFTDKELICDLLQDCLPQPNGGLVLTASAQPDSLPGLRQRWKFVSECLKKTRFLHIAQMIGSLGCPYKCAFCVDSTVRYQPQHPDQIYEDLVFVQKAMKTPFVSWYDPNFGVRFDDIMEVIERAAPGGAIRFAAESSLSLLSEPNLKRLGKNGFVALLPGVESWFGFGEKAGTKQLQGMDKVRAVADHLNLITRYVPYTQANFVMGLDVDEGAEPFELTKRLVDLSPGTFPGYSLFTAFGNSAPLFLELEKEGRLLDIPFPLLDNNSALNIRLKNYRVPEFYDHLIDLVGYSFSPRRVLRRFRTNRHATVKWLNLLRAVSSEGRGRHRYHRKLRSLMDTDTQFAAFLEGESPILPEFFRNKIRADLGVFFEQLPDDLRSYLTTGIRRFDRASVKVLPGARRASAYRLGATRKAENA